MKLKIKFDKKFFIIASACLVFVSGGIATTVILLNRKTDETFVEEKTSEATEIEYSEDEGRGSLDEEEFEAVGEESNNQTKESKKSSSNSSQNENVSSPESSSSNNQQKSRDNQEQPKQEEQPQQKEEPKKPLCSFKQEFGDKTPHQAAVETVNNGPYKDAYDAAVIEFNMRNAHKNDSDWARQKYAEAEFAKEKAYTLYLKEIEWYENLYNQRYSLCD